MRPLIYILSLAVFCAISYQLGFNQKNIMLYREIQSHNTTQVEYMRLKCDILEKQINETTESNDKILDIIMGAGVDLP